MFSLLFWVIGDLRHHDSHAPSMQLVHYDMHGAQLYATTEFLILKQPELITPAALLLAWINLNPSMDE